MALGIQTGIGNFGVRPAAGCGAPVLAEDEIPAGIAPGVHDPPSPALTPQQLRVLGLLADGVRAREIATQLGLSETTIRNHIRAMLGRLGCHSQLEAVAVARRLGLVGSPAARPVK